MAERALAFTFVYDDTPPSFNEVGHTGNRWAWTKAEKEWKGIFETLLMATGFPRDWEQITAVVRLRFPTKRRRDEVNYRTLLEKALGDALVNGRWLPDDTPEHFTFERVHFEQQTGKALTTIELTAR